MMCAPRVGTQAKTIFPRLGAAPACGMKAAARATTIQTPNSNRGTTLGRALTNVSLWPKAPKMSLGDNQSSQ